MNFLENSENIAATGSKQTNNLFKDIFGQIGITEKLTKAITNNRLHHAYLFSGPSGVGKEAIVLELIKIVNCENNNDKKNSKITYKPYCEECLSCRELSKFISDEELLYIFPKITKKGDSEKVIRDNRDKIIKSLAEKGDRKGYSKFSFKTGKTITLDQMNEIKKFSQYNSLRNSKKFVIINPAGAMNKEAQNSLLKILEEPPKDFHFFLICENSTMLLQTILSRCQHIQFYGLTDTELNNYLLKYENDEFLLKNIKKKKLTVKMRKNLVKSCNGSIDKLNLLLSGEMTTFQNMETKFYDMLLFATPAEMVRKVDKFIKEIKENEISEAELSKMIKQVSEKIVDELLFLVKKNSVIYANKSNEPNLDEYPVFDIDVNTKNSKISQSRNITNSMYKIIGHFDNAIYMIKRNINQRLLYINLYLNIREDFKSWKIKIRTQTY